MSLISLTSLVTPPEGSRRIANAATWKENSELYRIEYPSDYVALHAVYGDGSFAETFLWMFSPFRSNYEQDVESALGALQMTQEWGMKSAVYPESPGMFPWGRDEADNIYCWYTKGDPDTWRTVLLTHDSVEPFYFEQSTTEFLVSFLQNEYAERLGLEPFADSRLAFFPGGIWPK